MPTGASSGVPSPQPSHFARPAPTVLAPPVGRGRPRPRGVFPFGFGRQPIGPPGRLRHPGDVYLGVVPAHIDHRMIAASPALISGRRLHSAGIDAGVPFGERHLACARWRTHLRIVTLCGGDSRGLVVRAHDEIAGRHHDQAPGNRRNPRRFRRDRDWSALCTGGGGAVGATGERVRAAGPGGCALGAGRGSRGSSERGASRLAGDVAC